MLKKHLGFTFNVIALALFVPGILLPMFSLNMEMMASISGTSLSSELINKELSLIGTIEELWYEQRILVALLIFAFSICVPVVKLLLSTWAYFCKNLDTERRIINFIASIGKWSMADVFVVAIFLAVLSTNHAETADTSQLTMFGFQLKLMISSETLSSVGHGFYYFASYCLVALLGTQLSQSSVKARQV